MIPTRNMKSPGDPDYDELLEKLASELVDALFGDSLECLVDELEQASEHLDADSPDEARKHLDNLARELREMPENVKRRFLDMTPHIAESTVH